MLHALTDIRVTS